MDNPVSTEQPVQNIPNKKLFIGAAIFLAIVIVFVIITIISGTLSKKETVPQDISQQPPKNSQSAPDTLNQNSNPSVSPAEAAKWQTYKNFQFSINYPAEWRITELNLTGGIKGIEIKPVTGLGNIEKAIISISVNDPAVQSIKKNEPMYISLGFKQSNITVNNVSVPKLSGVLGSKTASISANIKSIHTGYVVLDDQSNKYLFDYSYLSSGSNLVLEDTIDKIIASFKSVQ
jgi:hypothetical protein